MPEEGGMEALPVVSSGSHSGGCHSYFPWAVGKEAGILRSIKICPSGAVVFPLALPRACSCPASAVG